MNRSSLRWFTLVELMIVIAIIGILVVALYPYLTNYIGRGRDVTRLSDIKELSAKFQEYVHVNEIMPDNTNQNGVTSYCISDIMLWDNATSIFPARQYATFWWTGGLRKDPMSNHKQIADCSIDWSYYYARVLKDTYYAVLAARMETQTAGSNWTGTTNMKDSGSINAIVQNNQLDKLGTYPDQFFVLAVN